MHHSLSACLLSWQPSRKSLTLTTRRCMERERAEKSIATGRFMLFPVLYGYVASGWWWPCRWYPKVPTAVLNTLGENLAIIKNLITNLGSRPTPLLDTTTKPRFLPRLLVVLSDSFKNRGDHPNHFNLGVPRFLCVHALRSLINYLC